MHQYEIHDNGGRPFLVNIDDSGVEVLFHKTKKGTGVAHKFTPKKVWVAEGEAFRFAHPDGDSFPEDMAYPPFADFKGNSILLEDEDGTYVHIGARIVRFTSEEPIEEFRSPVGNSNVPYPWANTGKNTILLGIGDVVQAPKTDAVDPWRLYYDTKSGVDLPVEELTARQW